MNVVLSLPPTRKTYDKGSNTALIYPVKLPYVKLECVLFLPFSTSGTIVPQDVYRRSLLSVAQNNSATAGLGRMSPRLVDALWAFLACCFFAAFCVHKVSSYLPTPYKACRLSVLFQDVIRYGKTKESYKRAKWMRVFDVPKR